MTVHSRLFLLLLLLSGCYYDVEEELYPSLECQVENVTYTGTILPLIRDNCYTCHDKTSNFGNVTLEGYDNLKIYVDNGRLLGAIKHEPGFSPMPQNRAPLLECEIQKIEEWIRQGAPDN
ncbi:MAG: hypothetical protein D6765_01995 [Bacteroidetes bacterium]|nr:MAG: hypothetical protein D6765_01995 [Bacteroidota bacterium]